MLNANYVDVIYNPSSKPFTDYPSKLINYSIKRYKLAKNSSLLELGCGRSEFLKEFIDQGMIGYRVDISDYAKSYCKDGKIVLCDLSKQKLPFSDNYFDIIKLLSFLTRILIPDYFRLKIKWIRFSKELMLLSSAYK